MKKIIFAAILSATGLLFAACQPEVLTGPKAAAPMEVSALQSAFVIDGQFADEACTIAQADGNYIKYHTSPAVTVQITYIKVDGSKSILTTAASGVFNITPKRGNPTTQSFTVSTINQDASVISFDSTVDVYVPAELEAGIKLLAGDGGSKSWKWYAIDDACWGNAGYQGAYGENDHLGEVPGKWWGCRPAASDDDVSGTFLDQLQHSGGTNYGDVYVNSYMTFDEDGNIISYKPDGTQIRKGTYTISDYDKDRTAYPMAKIVTSDPAILFPFGINLGGKGVSEFEVQYIDDNLLTLICNHNGAEAWGECTWWRFKNASDAEAALSAYGTRKWKWNTIDGATWGNGGYIGAPGQANLAAGEIPGKWWGCTPSELEDTQIQHSGGVKYGYGDDDAYMEFDYKNGTVTSYDKDGKAIKTSPYTVSYDFKVDGYTDAGVPAGTFVTESGNSGILYPFVINKGGVVESNYQLPYVDGNMLILISNYDNIAQWGWSECTWWRFQPVR